MRESVTRDDIDDAMHRCGWQLTNVVPPTGHHPGQLMFAAAQPETVLYLVQDLRLGVIYVAAMGQSAAALLDQVRFELPCEDADTWRELTADPQRLEPYRRGLAILALASPGASQAGVECFTAALNHPEPNVRTLALTAASYAPWPELRPALEQVRDQDAQPELSRAAAQLLEQLPS